MTFAQRIAGTAALGLAMLVGCGLYAPPAQAAYIVTLTQQGSSVVATGSGTIDLAGLRLLGPSGASALVNPSVGDIITGPTVSGTVDLYAGFIGPQSFGGGLGTLADTGSGAFAGIISDLNFLVVPRGYISGGSLSDSSTYDNQTFMSLGVTPGSYVWTWGSGLTADSFTLQIGPAAVPEPSSLALLVLPLGLAALAAVRGRPFHVKRRAAA